MTRPNEFMSETNAAEGDVWYVAENRLDIPKTVDKSGKYIVSVYVLDGYAKNTLNNFEREIAEKISNDTGDLTQGKLQELIYGIQDKVAERNAFIKSLPKEYFKVTVADKDNKLDKKNELTTNGSLSVDAPTIKYRDHINDGNYSITQDASSLKLLTVKKSVVDSRAIKITESDYKKERSKITTGKSSGVKTAIQ